MTLSRAIKFKYTYWTQEKFLTIIYIYIYIIKISFAYVEIGGAIVRSGLIINDNQLEAMFLQTITNHAEFKFSTFGNKKKYCLTKMIIPV